MLAIDKFRKCECEAYPELGPNADSEQRTSCGEVPRYIQLVQALIGEVIIVAFAVADEGSVSS